MVLPRVFDANGFCLLEHKHIRDENGLSVEITWAHKSGNTFKIKVGIPHDAFRKVFRSTPILIVNGTRCCVQFGDFITGETALPDSLLSAQ